MRNWLRKMRKGRNLSQRELGELLGLSCVTYSRIETGNRQQDLKFSVASKIADFFGIDLDDIKRYEGF